MSQINPGVVTVLSGAAPRHSKSHVLAEVSGWSESSVILVSVTACKLRWSISALGSLYGEPNKPRFPLQSPTRFYLLEFKPVLKHILQIIFVSVLIIFVLLLIVLDLVFV
jgi:hypothetical protein